jgi:ubiquinone/menaquinone biosynthesis C-methylase UbiE
LQLDRSDDIVVCKREDYRIPFVEYYLTKFVEIGDAILEIGCGMGQYRMSTQGFYVGLDVTNEPYGDIGPRVVDVVASGTDIPARAESFDFAFSVAALYQMTNPRRVLAECYRILKPGGRVLLFDYNRRTQTRLESGEGHKRPCWSQWELKNLVHEVGFAECELLLPVCREVGAVQRRIRLYRNELRGTWAIVMGIK